MTSFPSWLEQSLRSWHQCPDSRYSTASCADGIQQQLSQTCIEVSAGFFCCLLCLLVVSSLGCWLLFLLAAGPCLGVGMAVVLQCLSPTAGCCGTSWLQAAVLLIPDIFCLPFFLNNKVSAFCGIKHELYCPELSASSLCLHLSRFVVLGESNGFLSFSLPVLCYAVTRYKTHANLACVMS